MDKDKVKEVIQMVKPMLQADGGDVDLIDITDDGIVKVKLRGACGTCPMSQMTLKMGIEKEIKKAVPEIKSVVAI